MTESPFLPRERLFKQQQYFQNLTKHTYLKGRYDVVTSVAIPLALAASSLFMIGRGGVQHVSWGWKKGVNIMSFLSFQYFSIGVIASRLPMASFKLQK